MQTFPIDFDHDGVPTVARALGRGRPSAVGRFVSEIVVDPVDVMAVRPGTHVGRERFETPMPLVAHLDAASPVVLEGRVAGVIGSFFDRSPDSVDGVGWDAPSRVAGSAVRPVHSHHASELDAFGGEPSMHPVSAASHHLRQREETRSRLVQLHHLGGSHGRQ